MIRKSPVHGRGVFAAEWIPGGTRLVEYTGERLTVQEAEARYPEEDLSADYHTFLFAIDDDVVIDASRRPSMARWINHGCDPNCDAVVDDKRIFIESIRDIAPGEELLYDYNFLLDVRHTPARKRRYPCTCGAEACRRTMLGKKR